MSLPLVNDDHTFYYHTSSIGSLFVFVVVFITFLHVVYHYVKIFCRSEYSENDQNQNKTIYVLFFVICIITLYICTQYAFGRSNFLTQRSADSYTLFQCSFAHWSQYTLFVVFVMCIYGLFLYRIQIVFDGTMYEYPKKIYIALYVGLVIGALITLLFLFISINDTKFVLFYFGSDKFVYCDSFEDGQKSKRYKFNLIGTSFFILLQIVYNIILLYMFTKRLYSLQIELLKQYIAEANKYESTTNGSLTPIPPQTPPKTPDQESPITPNKATHISPNSSSHFEITKSRTITVEDVISETKKNDQAAKRILNLHKMLKKFTILIWIQIVSSIIWLGLMVGVSSWMWLQLVWLLLINNICTWLMFATSYKYYKFTTQYCCCYLCYFNRKKDIGSKTCLCFC